MSKNESTVKKESTGRNRMLPPHNNRGRRYNRGRRPRDALRAALGDWSKPPVILAAVGAGMSLVGLVVVPVAAYVRTEIKRDVAAIRDDLREDVREIAHDLGRRGEPLDRLAAEVAGLGDKVQSVANKMQSVEDRLQGVEDRLASVEDRLTTVEDRLQGVEDRLEDAESIGTAGCDATS